MRRITKPLALAGIAFTLLIGSNQLNAQQRPTRGDFDPAQFRERMAQIFRERLEIKDDDEWKVIQPRLQKVIEARRETSSGGGAFGGRAGFGGRREGGREANQGRPDRADRGDRGDRNAREGFRGGTRPSPEAEALRAALDSNASAEQLKAKLAQFREARKQKQAQLEQAQIELRKVLTSRQEALAVLNGYLD